jgi:hypothetical protein
MIAQSMSYGGSPSKRRASRLAPIAGGRRMLGRLDRRQRRILPRGAIDRESLT